MCDWLKEWSEENKGEGGGKFIGRRVKEEIGVKASVDDEVLSQRKGTGCGLEWALVSLSGLDATKFF